MLESNGGGVVQFWLQLYKEPSEKELQILEQVIMAWFITGRAGGYDAANLQVDASCCVMLLNREPTTTSASFACL